MFRPVELRSVPVPKIFNRFLEFLGDENMCVVKSKKLEQGLLGYTKSYEGGLVEIGISSSRLTHKKQDEELGTLVHELCHVMFWYRDEGYILQLDGILMKKLNRKQKAILKSYIPGLKTRKAQTSQTS